MFKGLGCAAIKTADDIIQGKFKFFSYHQINVGFPPSWNTNPLTNLCIANDKHWSLISDFDQGDIKWIWELSRFSWAFHLVRAYYLSDDEQYAEAFWQLLTDWCKNNPPNSGPQWKCGQEIALRCLALCFARYAFHATQASSKTRLDQLEKVIYVSALRIESNLYYALSQKNNHGISEAIGLWTIGLLFPHFRQAKHWQALGGKWLSLQAKELIYSDGAFSQHSFNYQRLMLQLYLWYMQLAKVNQLDLDPEVYQRVRSSYLFLYQLQDQTSGRVPNYGQNDGALLLALNDCDYRDFRPLLQALHYFYTGKRLYPEGPWDEDLVWLFGAQALSTSISSLAQADVQMQEGGYHVIQGADTWLFTRCVKQFKHRPGQADILQLDLWWKGINIICDAGTYSYNAPSPWDNPFAGSANHNVLTVDRTDQMQKLSRFLWLPWAQGQYSRIQTSAKQLLKYWWGEHNGYQQQGLHIRYRRHIILVTGNHWLVIDKIAANTVHDYDLHYLLTDMPYELSADAHQLKLKTQAGDYWLCVANADLFTSRLIRADELSPQGWISNYYSAKQPGLAWLHSVKANNGIFLTSFGEKSVYPVFNSNLIQVQLADTECKIEIIFNGDNISSIKLTGFQTDSLQME